MGQGRRGDIINKFWQRSGDIGIDLGTANTLIAMRDRGLILEEPSIVTVDRVRGVICAVGTEAKAMMGRTPAHLSVVRPLRDGVVADLNVTRQMLEHFVGRVYRGRGFMSPRVMVGVPTGITEVERRAVESAAETATGARQAHTIEEPMAAAFGAGLPVDDSAGSMIVDIGGGTTEVAVISLGGIVVARSTRIGGDEVDEALRSHIRHTHNLAVGEISIEKLKIDAASAYAVVPDSKILVRGRSLVTGLPASIEISSGELRAAIREPVAAIIETVRATLEGAPPELCADIMERGITLAGGGSLLRGLNVAIERALGTKAVVCDSPMAAVALGTIRALERRSK